MNDFIVGVPFSGCEKEIGTSPLIATREDESLGIAVGAYFAGKKPLVFICLTIPRESDRNTIYL